MAVTAIPARVNVVAVSPPPTVTSSGSPTVTVPFDLETSTSFVVPLIAITAPFALSPSEMTPDDASKSSASNAAIPFVDPSAAASPIDTSPPAVTLK